MKKRILASLMSLCLLVGLLPTAVFAAEETLPTEQVEQPATCTCSALCTEESTDSTCLACMEGYEFCTYGAQADEEEPVPCTETEGCTLEAGHEGECVVDPADPVEGKPSQAGNDPNAQPGDEDGSEVCGNLEGCDGDTHEPECPLYVAPVEPVAENVILAPAPVAGDEMLGNCGAEDNESGVTWKLEQNNEDTDNPTYTLTISGSGAMADYNVDTSNQSTNGYYKVTDSPWLNYADKITKIDLSTSITKIGKGAFNSCAITELPWSGKETQYSTLTEIGQFAFAGCTALTEVTFVPSVTTYGNYAFEGCTGLTSIDWTNYQPSAENSDKLSVNGVLVATGLFAECSSLTSDFALPEQIIGIDRAAFRNTGYTAIDFTTDAPGVKVIEEQAFSGSKLASITLPSADTHPDTKFGVGAFSGTGVTTISIPYYSQSDNANVSEQMFKDCKSLSSVVLGDGITSIGKNAFSGTTVSAINWPASLTTIGDYAFNGAKFDSLDIPSNITTIGGQAFYSNKDLKSVVIRAGSVSIGYAAFAQCENLETIDLSEVTSLTATNLGQNSGSFFMSIKDGSVLYVKDASLISSADGKWYSVDETARIVVGDATVDTTKTGFEAVTKAGYAAQWYSNSQCTGDPVTEISKTENYGRSYPIYYAKWTLAAPAVTVSADKTYISSGETSTLTATTQHGLAGVTYEYQWYAGSPDKGTKIDGATSQSYSVSSLNQASTYYCEVVAVNGADKSEAGKSKAVTITPANAKGSVTITNDKTSAIYGDEPFTFSYTASGEATVTSSDPSIAAVSDNNGTVTVTIAGAGTAEISVDFEGSTEYSTASDKFTLTVAKATLTITADDKSIYVGDTLPTYTYTVSGLVGYDRLTTKPTVTCAGADANKAGTYTITATGADAGNNYTINYVDGTLTVSRRSSGGGGGSGSSSHSVSVDSDKNGSVSVNKDNASQGSTVTITVKPDSGYELGDLIVTDKNGNEIKLTDKGNGKYTFKMPGSKVEIEASFVPQADPDIGLPFNDIPSGSWYEDAVWYVYENGLMAGTSDTTFEPDTTTSRGMIVTVLYRLEGAPTVSGASGFTDVADGQYYADAVAWAAANNIVGGYGNGLFGPNDTITREQMAAILYRYAQYKGYDVTASADLSDYSDVAQVSSYALAALQWANAEGLVNGTSDTTLTPGGSATRAQVAVILMRFCENIAEK